MSKFKPRVTQHHFAELYGMQILEFAELYGMQILDFAELYGMQILEFAELYGMQILEFVTYVQCYFINNDCIIKSYGV